MTAGRDAGRQPRRAARYRRRAITARYGTLRRREPKLFDRWEWHDLASLGCLGPIFTRPHTSSTKSGKPV